MKTVLTIAVILGLAGGGTYCYLRYVRSDNQTSFRTAKVERGDMMPTIGATGTIEPEEVVDIGAQVAGLVTEFGRDLQDSSKPIDYGSVVEKGTVLAKIDPRKYAASYDKSTATVASAKANLALAQATLKKTRNDLDRATELLKTKAMSKADFDAAQAAYDVAVANVGVAQASIGQAEADQRSVKTDLDYTTIVSPEKGVIVDRRVNVGQTVVAALNTPSLFLLAKDLSRVQIWASVNEADIGRIHLNQKAMFTVDTYPNDTFEGWISQVRLNATMTQNVVTYTVVVTTENKDLRLLPYMTANVNFEIEHHSDVLKVPNAALRWKPTPQQIAPDIRADTLAMMNRPSRSKSKGGEDDPASDSSKGAGASPGAASKDTATGLKPEDWKARTEADAQRRGKKPADNAAQAKGDGAEAKKPAITTRGAPGMPVSEKVLAAKKDRYDTGFIWTADGNFVRPVKVRIIATDGTNTEVREVPSKDSAEKKLQEDLEVVTGVNIASESDDTTNPFMPKLFRGGGSGARGK